MSIFASIYTDEDVAKLVSTLLKSRGINATNTPEQRKIRGRNHSGIMIAPTKMPQEIVLRAMVLLDALTLDEVENQLLYL
jgi:ribosome-interacting GTPase 1